MSNTDLVQKLWQLFSEQRWEESKTLFHTDFSAHWPQSKEKFVGANNFVSMNAEYPGNHVAEITNILAQGEFVACTVYISADTGQTAYGTSYFEFKDGKILRMTEYWGEEYPAPDSRKKWTES